MTANISKDATLEEIKEYYYNKLGRVPYIKPTKRFFKFKGNKYVCCLDTKAIKKINKLINVELLPENIDVSTITMTCSLGTKIYLENVARFIDLNLSRIQSIKYGCHPSNNRILKGANVKKAQQGKKKKKNFYNEATIKVCPGDDGRPINIKIFKNGSLQLTGVKAIDDFCDVVSKLIFELRKEKVVIKHGKVIKKPFLEDMSSLGLKNIKICMINTNFKVKYKIDREQLYSKLLDNKINCTFEPFLHACVNIKYVYSPQKTVSIFVFMSGSIIITGSNTIDQVAHAYKFIIDKLEKYKELTILAQTDHIFSMSKKLQEYL